MSTVSIAALMVFFVQNPCNDAPSTLHFISHRLFLHNGVQTNVLKYDTRKNVHSTIGQKGP